MTMTNKGFLVACATSLGVILVTLVVFFITSTFLTELQVVIASTISAVIALVMGLFVVRFIADRDKIIERR